MENPDSVDMLVRLLMITDGKEVDKEVESFRGHYVPFMGNPDELLVEFEKLMDFKSFCGASKMGLLIKALWNGGDKYFFDDKIGEALYRSGDYGSVIRMYSDKAGGMINWPEGLVLVYLLSLIKSDSKKLCRDYVDGLLRDILKGGRVRERSRKIDEELRIRGLVGCLSFMQKSLGGEDVDERLYNPFIE